MGEAIRTTKRPSGQRAPRRAARQGAAPPAADAAALGFRARSLARGQGQGALATLDAQGAPFASFVAVGWTVEGKPLFLLSTLADHTRNLMRDARASLLVAGTPGAKAQATARITLQGRVAPVDDDLALTRYLVRHPEARAWAGFADFRLYRMEVAACRAVLGFAQAHRLTGRQYLASVRKARALDRHAPALLRCVMEDADLRGGVAQHARHASADGGARAAGAVPALADCDGLDLVHRTNGRTALRLCFDDPAFTPDAWRDAVQRAARAATRQR